jgi:hypothetical protein
VLYGFTWCFANSVPNLFPALFPISALSLSSENSDIDFDIALNSKQQSTFMDAFLSKSLETNTDGIAAQISTNYQFAIDTSALIEVGLQSPKIK